MSARLARLDALVRGVHAGGGLHALRVDHTGRRLGALALLLPDQLPQQAVELGEHAVLLPLREVPVDRLPGREVVRQIAALHPDAAHIEDRVQDLAQVVPGRALEVQGTAATLEAPGGQDRLHQFRGRHPLQW
jgi:hypothetical protein